MPAPCDAAPNPAPLAIPSRIESRRNSTSPTAIPKTPVTTTNSATRSGWPPSGLAAASANGVVTERTARLRWISSDRVNSRASQTELHTATTVAVTTPALSDIQWRLIIARLS